MCRSNSDANTKLQQNIGILAWNLIEFIGFHQKLISTKDADLVAAAAFDANRRLNLMYIYYDLASHAIVGDTKTPLFRVCSATGWHGQVMRPHYLSVSRREFDSIEVARNKDFAQVDEAMLFEFGKIDGDSSFPANAMKKPYWCDSSQNPVKENARCQT
jgi:hypothetical protein